MVAFFSSQARSEVRPPSLLAAALLDVQPVILSSSSGSVVGPSKLAATKFQDSGGLTNCSS